MGASGCDPLSRPRPGHRAVSPARLAGSILCWWDRTGSESVTSSVSGKFRAVPGVCHGRTESDGEPLSWADLLSGSR
jgi:hypothetical protein